MQHAGYAPIRRFAMNERGRDLIVGDIHGCFRRLRVALDERCGLNQRTSMFPYLEEAIVGALVACGVIGALITLALIYGIPWLWSMLKPWLHIITA